MEQTNSAKYSVHVGSLSNQQARYTTISRAGQNQLQQLRELFEQHKIEINAANEFKLLGLNFVLKFETQFKEMNRNGFISVHQKTINEQGHTILKAIEEFSFSESGQTIFQQYTHDMFLGAIIQYISEQERLPVQIPITVA